MNWRQLVLSKKVHRWKHIAQFGHDTVLIKLFLTPAGQGGDRGRGERGEARLRDREAPQRGQRPDLLPQRGVHAQVRREQEAEGRNHPSPSPGNITYFLFFAFFVFWQTGNLTAATFSVPGMRPASQVQALQQGQRGSEEHGRRVQAEPGGTDPGTV